MTSCNRCSGPLGQWEIEIRDEYRCWKCAQFMQILLVFRRGSRDSGIPTISELAYRRPTSLIPLASEHGVLLERRYSRTMEDRYIMHICPHCKAGQGDNFVVEDLHQETRLVKVFPATSCRNCNTWEPL